MSSLTSVSTPPAYATFSVVVLRYRVVSLPDGCGCYEPPVIESPASSEPDLCYCIGLFVSLAVLLLATESLTGTTDFSTVLVAFIESLFKEDDAGKDEDETLKDDDNHILDVEEHWDLEGIKVQGKVEEGVNGVYIVGNDKEETLGVFKPRDEELFSSANPKAGQVVPYGEMSPLKAGIVVGDTPVKEHAAYVLDRNNIARVPFTETVVLEGSFGSLQRYVKHLGSAEDYSSSKFSVRDVQSIALLDLRTMNIDRHMGNMLVVEQQQPSKTNGQLGLVPIDHGYILPDFRYLSDAWFEWYMWPQVSRPVLPELKEYVREIDVRRDAAQLLRLGMRPESVITYILCTIFVKRMVAKDFTLSRIAMMMQRDITQPDAPSELEQLILNAMERMHFDTDKGVCASSFHTVEFESFITIFDSLCYKIDA